MIIDIHTHITDRRFPEFGKVSNTKPFPPKFLLERMDKEGIDRSVLLPLANPENVDIFGVAGNQECIQAARKHPDRLITFCNVDPRGMLNTPAADFSTLLKVYKDLGCVGIGEVCANLPITDPRFKNLFHHAGVQGLPVLMHMSSREGGLYGVIDKFHLTGLEEVLKEIPKTVFIGHAMSFWGEIDGDLREEQREDYAPTPIKREGTLWRLLRTYPNLYGDLSAWSGCNAVSRDPETGYRFLQKFNRNLFFGTDRFSSRTGPIPPIITFLKNARKAGKITKSAYENIMVCNYTRVFGVPGA